MNLVKMAKEINNLKLVTVWDISFDLKRHFVHEREDLRYNEMDRNS